MAAHRVAGTKDWAKYGTGFPGHLSEEQNEVRHSAADSGALPADRRRAAPPPVHHGLLGRVSACRRAASARRSPASTRFNSTRPAAFADPDSVLGPPAPGGRGRDAHAQ